MSKAAILNGLDSLKDLTNDSGKAVIEGIKSAVRQLVDPEELVSVQIRQEDIVPTEEVKKEPKGEVKEEAKEEEKAPHHKTLKKRK